jgi:hypothetical protein
LRHDVNSVLYSLSHYRLVLQQVAFYFLKKTN